MLSRAHCSFRNYIYTFSLNEAAIFDKMFNFSEHRERALISGFAFSAFLLPGHGLKGVLCVREWVQKNSLKFSRLEVIIYPVN